MPENQIDGTWSAGEVCNKPIVVKHDDEQIIYAITPLGTYRKSTDQGASWSARQSIFTRETERIAIWYGQSNYDNPTELIYVVGLVNTDALRAQAWFRTIDPSNGDALGSEVIIDSAVGTSGRWDDNGWSISFVGVGGGGWCGIVRTDDGTLYAAGEDNAPSGADLEFTAKSEDDGATWSPISDLTESPEDPDRWWMFPDLYGDPGDLIVLYEDTEQDQWTFKRYDRSGDSWAESAAFQTRGAANNEDICTAQATWDPRTGDIYAVLHELSGLSTYHTAGPFDIEAWKWSDGVVSQLTDVRPGVTDAHLAVEITRDDGGRLHVFTIDGTNSLGTTNEPHHHTSDDDGVTWDDQGVIGDTTIRHSSGFYTHNAYPGQTILFPPYKDATADNDFSWQVIISTPTPPPSAGLPVAVLCDFGYEFDELIDPAGTAFRLSDGLGKHLMVESGTGLPPINYLTQRAPYVDGEQLFDYRLQARSVRQTYRHRGRNRADRWRLYEFLIDALRPNRQVAPWQVVETLRLRKYLPDGSRWDLNVMPDLAPMGQRRGAGWDEWSLQEAIRFIAFDPVYFDPDQTVVTLTDLDEQLVLGDNAQGIDGGMDFEPGERIWFGGGLNATVVYDGNWFAQPVIEITGPVTDPIITNDSIVERIALDYAIEAGEVVTIDTREASRSVVSGLVGSITGLTLNPSTLATFRLEPEPTAPGGENPIRLFGSGIVDGQTSVTVRYNRRKIALGQ